MLDKFKEIRKMKTAKRLLAVTVVFAALCAGSLTAQAVPVVVIAPFDAKGVSKDEADVITEIFTAEYAAAGGANVVDRTSFDKIRAQLSFQTSDWSNSNKVAQLGKALNANQVVVGQLFKFREQIVIAIKVIDVNTTTILASHTEKVSDVEKLFDKISGICQKLSEACAVSGMQYKVGDEGPGGGIVFYASKEGFTVYDGQGEDEICHYLEMSKTSLGMSYSSDAGIVLTENGLGWGKSNCYKILQESYHPTESSCAAYRCSLYATATTKQGDWFLPSKDELNLMYQTQRARVLATSSEDWWLLSSSYTHYEPGDYYACQNFYSGETDATYDACSVRAIRAF